MIFCLCAFLGPYDYEGSLPLLLGVSIFRVLLPWSRVQSQLITSPTAKPLNPKPLNLKPCLNSMVRIDCLEAVAVPFCGAGAISVPWHSGKSTCLGVFAVYYGC